MRPQIDWLNPDYEAIYAYRAEALQRLHENPGAVGPLMQYYKNHWEEFIQDWMVTYDPRLVPLGKSPTMPFILFPRQVEFVQWVRERWLQRERGLTEKSRDMGISWLSCACAVCVWLFYDEVNIGFGSRKKESVDNGDADPDSLFWKIRKLITTLPSIFIPEGFGDGNKWGIVYNPKNRSTIKGEIGDAIGMGGRTTLHFVDEADALEHPMLAEQSLSATTDCRVDVSTTNNVGTVFYNNRRSLPTHQVFIFDWTEDPRKRLNPSIPPKEEPWYRKQLAQLDRSVVASQIDRNPSAALANTFISVELIEDAEDRKLSSITVPDATPWCLGVDAAGMGNDEIILWWRRGRVSLPPTPLPNMDGVQLAARIEREAERKLKIAPIALISIERDGPGGSAADQLKYTKFNTVLRALHTGAKLSDGKHYNIRAWLHAQAKEYLQEDEPFLPKDPTFKAQATALLYEYKAAKLLIESKDDYRRRLSGEVSKVKKAAGKSPDRWDAFVLTFAPPTGKLVRQEEVGLVKGTGWKPLDATMGY